MHARKLLAGDTLPAFQTIPDATVEVGSPLHIPIDGIDEDGDALTVTVEIDDPTAVEAVVLSGNRSWRIDVQNFGTMVFELFEQRAPRPSARIVELTESGFYDRLTFHRIVDDFVIQGGDPQGDGTGGSTLGDFDDQFHPDLQHNRDGILSFAKSSDDTNDSQFFVTQEPTRFLDYNHSIFGQQIEGFDVLQTLNGVETDGNDLPLDPVVITSATIFEDVQNSVVMFRALRADVVTTVTVTIEDDDGNQFDQSFEVSTIADADNANPYLVDFDSDIVLFSNQVARFDLDAVDIEGDPIFFGGQFLTDPQGSGATLDSASGEFELTPAADFVGTIELIVGSGPISSGPFDTQQVTLEFIPMPVPDAPILAAASDTGALDSDAITSATSWDFTLGNLVVGATVELVDTTTNEVVATETATDTSINITVDVAARDDGSYRWAVRQTVAEAVSDFSDGLDLTLDRESPTILDPGFADEVFGGETLQANLASDNADIWGLVGAPEGAAIDENGLLTWTPADPVTREETFEVVASDLAGNESRRTIMAQVFSRLHNAELGLDVNLDGRVTALDALLVINQLIASGSFELTEAPDDVLGSSRLNVNDDDRVSSLDAILIVNQLIASPANSEPEPEALVDDTLVAWTVLSERDGEEEGI
ncbi:MAG: peptidylprolyl isomerase [Planctomycetota bacterium]